MTIVGTRDAGHTARVGLHDINLGTTVILVTSSCYVMFTEGPVGPKLMDRKQNLPAQGPDNLAICSLQNRQRWSVWAETGSHI